MIRDTTAPANAPWFDPDWLIQRTLESGLADEPGTAEDVLLAWIVRLPVGHDPAEAAGHVLERYADGLRGSRTRHLAALLEETRSCTPDRLARLRPQRRRRHRQHTGERTR